MILFLSLFLLAANQTPAAQRPISATAAERSADPRDRMICKRFVETGSLVRGYRTCKTKAEWDRERDNIRTDTGLSDSCRTRGTLGGC